MGRFWLIWAGFHGFLSVACGAFAAHGLKDHLDADSLKIIETGARYEMYTALALLGVAALSTPTSSGKANLKAAGWCLALGGLIFSGSLYALALSGIKAFGIATPVGGLLLLGAWALLAWEGFKRA